MFYFGSFDPSAYKVCYLIVQLLMFNEPAVIFTGSFAECEQRRDAWIVENYGAAAAAGCTNLKCTECGDVSNVGERTPLVIRMNHE